MTTTTITNRPGQAGAVPQVGPAARCPHCGAELDGGPVTYWCSQCGRGVMAADLDTSYHPPSRAEAGTSTLGGSP